MNTSLNLTQEQLQKISINQIQSLSILSLSAESLRDLLQKESEENPFMEYTPSSTSYMTSDGASSFLNFICIICHRGSSIFRFELASYFCSYGKYFSI